MSRVIADGLSKRVTATTAEAEAGTVDKFPDAAGVHSAFGQYGLGVRPEVITTDANNLTKSGFYYLSGVSDNLPTTSAHRVMVISGAASGSPRVTQIAFNWGNNSQHIRYFDNSGVWSQWVRIYNQESILGTVSQSGSVPTGAIIERGSNANGEYVKFADGTLIVHINQISSRHNLSRSGTASVTLPVEFANTNYSFAAFPQGYSNTSLAVNHVAGCLVANKSTTGLTFRTYEIANYSSADYNVYSNLTVTGRWW